MRETTLFPERRKRYDAGKLEHVKAVVRLHKKNKEIGNGHRHDSEGKVRSTWQRRVPLDRMEQGCQLVSLL